MLSIAAAKLGFAPIVAVDVDPAAVEAVSRNAEANGVEIEVRHGDALELELPTVDVVVANIHLAGVEALARRVRRRGSSPPATSTREMPEAPGFVHLERRIDGGWAADLFERQ